MSRLKVRVAHPPAQPLLVYDGACGFCKLWIARWQEETGNAVAYEPLQEAAARFPEVPRAEFERAVKLIEPDGSVRSGADAVFHSLGKGKGIAPARWAYENVPGFAAMSEAAYRFVAGHRNLAQKATHLLWGEDVRRPRYFSARRWFLRSLGAIYLIAFLSLWVQVDGLIGPHGVARLADFLQAAQAQLGVGAYQLLPTLCWWNSSAGFLHFLCGAGALVSVLLVAGFAPLLCLVLLFVDYLSLTIAGQEFLSFQWDILLLETGFLAIFLAPWRWWMRAEREAPLSPVAVFLLHCLLFKLMFLSGLVKLTSGDDSWWNLTALDYHFWTQPLPTVIGWWADKSPEWLKHFSTALTLVIELAAPLLFWAPRRLRTLAAGATILLQIGIGLTGNYAFFNLLTIALCLLLIDDYTWRRSSRLTPNDEVSGRAWPQMVPVFVLVVTLPLNAMLLYEGFRPGADWPRPLASLYGLLQPFRLVNGYGLFRVMTKDRPEIVIEGSADGIEWKPYVFRWKPGPLERSPGFVEPHQPRLDWQMWFAALGDVSQNRWFVGLIVRLLEGSPDVLHLLAQNPFPEKPPRYIRAELYRYRFATPAEHARSGVWWTRTDLREYFPEISRVAK